MAKTTQEQLDDVNSAIDAITGGAQEYQVGGKRVKRAELSVLFKERSRLENKLHMEENSGGITYYGSTT